MRTRQIAYWNHRCPERLPTTDSGTYLSSPTDTATTLIFKNVERTHISYRVHIAEDASLLLLDILYHSPYSYKIFRLLGFSKFHLLCHTRNTTLLIIRI